MTTSPAIELLQAKDFGDFVTYLNDHLSDNGNPGTGYFQPLPRDRSRFSADREAAFRTGLDISLGEKGWRRLWVARSAERHVIGHIDLRAHPDPFAEHRCLLGMGVDRNCRRLGLGRALIASARGWARDVAHLEWIDLQVLSANQRAVSLYRRAGFLQVGEINDMFRIDGHSFSYTTMSMQLGT